MKSKSSLIYSAVVIIILMLVSITMAKPPQQTKPIYPNPVCIEGKLFETADGYFYYQVYDENGEPVKCIRG